MIELNGYTFDLSDPLVLAALGGAAVVLLMLILLIAAVILLRLLPQGITGRFFKGKL
jgi:hypothetical protein